MGERHALPFCTDKQISEKLRRISTCLSDPFDYQVLNLSQQFYADYPEAQYKEILKKQNRPYNCLLIQSHYGYFICIPYRTEINHKYAYKFKNSKRSKKHKSGLDYSKMAIIQKVEYLEQFDAVIDREEYKETRDNIEYIKKDAQEYIDNYVNQILGISLKYDEKEFQRIYQYSTLQYFHKELGVLIR